MKRLIIMVIATLAVFFLANAANPPQKTTVKKPTTTTKAVVKTATTTKPVVNKPTTAKKPVAKKPVAKAVKKDSATTNEKHLCIYITKADFIKKVSDIETNPNSWQYLGDKPCIIDFYTTWCGPCRVIAPILEDLAKEYEGKIIIYKIDAEKEVQLAQAFKVQAYPTLIFCPMKGGPQMAKGALPKAQLVEIIEEVLLKDQAPPPPALLQRR